MFCRKCGRQLSEGAIFCPACGTKVVSANASNNVGMMPEPKPVINRVQEPVKQDDSFGWDADEIDTSDTYTSISSLGSNNASSSVSKVAEAVQNAGESIVVLLAGVFGLLSVLVRIISQIRISVMYSGMVYSSGAGVVGNIITLLFSQIFLILISIGMILIFASSKSRSGKAGGYSMIKVVCVIKIVLMAILCGLLLIGLIIGVIFAGAKYSELPDFMRGNMLDILDFLGLRDGAATAIVILIVALTIIVLSFVLYFMWYSKMIKTMNLAKSALSGSFVVGRNVSTFVIVFKFIGLFFEFISVIAGIAGMGLRFGIPYEMSQALSLIGFDFSTNAIATLFVFLFGLFYVISLIKAKGVIGAAMR